MGAFEFTPDSGEEYTAKVSCNNKEYSFKRPKTLSSGYVMRVNNLRPEAISVEIEKTADCPAQTLGITFVCRGIVYAFQSFTVNENGRSFLRLPKKDLPSGVFQITVFTSGGEILAQRQTFVKNGINYLPVKTTKIQSTFEPYSPIEIAFEIRDENNIPKETAFSLAVRDDAATTGTNYTDNILCNLLLSSELKGYIENPAYYFEADDHLHRIALDLLMLTQGWTRYSWKQMSGVETFEVKYGIEKSLMIEGAVLSSGLGKPQKDIEVTMWMTLPDALSQRGT
jgi:hypothetical protein